MNNNLCRCLNDFSLYVQGAIGLGGSLFNSNNPPTVGKSNVICSGNETRLVQCSADTFSNFSCETASAVCQGKLIFLMLW